MATNLRDNLKSQLSYIDAIQKENLRQEVRLHQELAPGFRQPVKQSQFFLNRDTEISRLTDKLELGTITPLQFVDAVSLVMPKSK